VCGPSRPLVCRAGLCATRGAKTSAHSKAHSRRARTRPHAPTRQPAGNMSSRGRRTRLPLANDQNGYKPISSQLLQASHRSGASSAMLARALHLNLASSRDQTPASAPSSARSATSSRRSQSPSSRGLFPSPLLAASACGEDARVDALSDPDVIEHGVGMRIEQRGHGIMCVHASFLPLSVPSLFLACLFLHLASSMLRLATVRAGMLQPSWKAARRNSAKELLSMTNSSKSVWMRD
jgi:hypothetical protein